MVVLTPRGYLQGPGSRVERAQLVEQDLLDSVVMLPRALFPHLPEPPVLLVLRRDKPEASRYRVRFVRGLGRGAALPSRDRCLVQYVAASTLASVGHALRVTRRSRRSPGVPTRPRLSSPRGQTPTDHGF